MKRAFTLSEVLVTLCIVGVVAAMTVPAVSSSYKKQATQTRLKKIYGKLLESVQIGRMDEGWDVVPLADGSDASIQNWNNNMLKANLNVKKECYNAAGCWNKGTLMLDGTKHPYDKGNKGIGGNNVTFITNDGYMVGLDGSSAGDLKSKYGVNTAEVGAAIFVDINGAKKPNKIGQDVFVLTYTMERGLLPAGTDQTDADVKKNCLSTGMYCLEQVVRDEWTVKNLKL